MDTFNLRFYDLISISAPGLPGAFKRKIKEKLNHFILEPGDTLSEPPDIVLSPMVDPPMLDNFSEHVNHIYGFSLVNYQERDVICFFHRGEPEICLFFKNSGTLELHYRPSYRSSSKARAVGFFWGLLMFCCNLMLKLKNRLLCHGVVVERDGKALIVSGHRGIGKTPLLLSLLRRGFNYISDDKFLLSSQRVSMVETKVFINQYHFKVLPWLDQYIEAEMKTLVPLSVRQAMHKAIGRIWPASLPSKVYCYLNPGMQIDLTENPFGTGVVKQAVPNLCVILQGGQHNRFKTLTRSQGVGRLALLQKLFFGYRFELETSLLISGTGSPPSMPRILEENLPLETRFLLSPAPDKGTMDSVCEKILSHWS